MSLIFNSDFENLLATDNWTAVISGDSSVARSESAAKLHSWGLNVDRLALTSGAARQIIEKSLAPGESLFVGFWMKVNTLEPASQNDVIVNHAYASASLRTYMQLYADGRLRFFQYSNDGLEASDFLTWGQGWRHFIHEYQRAQSGTVDGAYRVYCDGELILENINRTHAVFDSENWMFSFGGLADSGDCGVNFDVDDVRVGEALEDVLPAASYLIYNRNNELLHIASPPVTQNFSRSEFPLSLYWQGYQGEAYFLSSIMDRPVHRPVDLMVTPKEGGKYDLMFSFAPDTSDFQPSAFEILTDVSGPVTSQSPVLTTLSVESESDTAYSMEIELESLPVWLAVRGVFSDNPGNISDSLLVKASESLSCPALEIS